MENPYQAPSSRVEDLERRDEALAGRWLRFGAVFIDGLIQGGLFLAIAVPSGYQRWVTESVRTGELSLLNYMLLSAAIGLVVFLLIQGYPLVTSAQTWGKKACSIKIVDLDGRMPSLGRLGTRYLLIMLPSMIPFVGALFGIVDILFIFREDRRCIHDLVGGTRVVMA